MQRYAADLDHSGRPAEVLTAIDGVVETCHQLQQHYFWFNHYCILQDEPYAKQDQIVLVESVHHSSQSTRKGMDARLCGANMARSRILPRVIITGFCSAVAPSMVPE